MKKYVFLFVAIISLTVVGCKSIYHNNSLDDIWIQEQVNQGNQLPAILK